MQRRPLAVGLLNLPKPGIRWKAPPFLDCRQEAVDSGDCGHHDVGGHLRVRITLGCIRNVGSVPRLGGRRHERGGATGGACAAWTRDGVFVRQYRCGGETRYESTANAAH